jgi:hypothetical protein
MSARQAESMSLLSGQMSCRALDTLDLVSGTTRHMHFDAGFQSLCFMPAAVVSRAARPSQCLVSRTVRVR